MNILLYKCYKEAKLQHGLGECDVRQLFLRALVTTVTVRHYAEQEVYIDKHIESTNI
jgi:hypothetical protein